MHILYNARIHTLDPQRPVASALAIEAGRLIALSDDPDSLFAMAVRPERHDLGGRTIIPGLVDAHLHLQKFAFSLQLVDCETPSRSECLERVAERARHTPLGAWILGHGWNQANWPEGFGVAADLDRVAPDNPVYLTAKSLHAAWANSAALRLAGIHPGSPDPAGGRLGRGEDGAPDGIFFENALQFISDILPGPTLPEAMAAIRTAQSTLWRMGLTGVHDFDGKLSFQALQALHSNRELHLRVLKGIPLELLPHAAQLGLQTGFGDDFLRIGQVKLFADGALGPQTAAMLQPYQGSLENRGMLLLDGEEIFEHGRQAVESGLALATHAIGDRANHEVLEGYAQLRRYEKSLESSENKPPLRHRIEHVQLLHPDDVSRLADLQIIASMQPVHVISDMDMASRYWGDRAAFSYAWRSQLQYGAILAFGSDAPVESPDPIAGLHAAVTRRQRNGDPGLDGWYPQQRLSVLEALRGFTSGPAYAAGMEDRLGRLAPGFLADLVVLDQDPFTCLPEDLQDIHPLATMVGGEWVYSEL